MAKPMNPACSRPPTILRTAHTHRIIGGALTMRGWDPCWVLSAHTAIFRASPNQSYQLHRLPALSYGTWQITLRLGPACVVWNREETKGGGYLAAATMVSGATLTLPALAARPSRLLFVAQSLLLLWLASAPMVVTAKRRLPRACASVHCPTFKEFREANCSDPWMRVQKLFSAGEISGGKNLEAVCCNTYECVPDARQPCGGVVCPEVDLVALTEECNTFVPERTDYNQLHYKYGARYATITKPAANETGRCCPEFGCATDNYKVCENLLEAWPCEECPSGFYPHYLKPRNPDAQPRRCCPEVLCVRMGRLASAYDPHRNIESEPSAPGKRRRRRRRRRRRSRRQNRRRRRRNKKSQDSSPPVTEADPNDYLTLPVWSAPMEW